MPVPTLISELSQTAASNSPPGSESPTTADDYLRTYASFIALHRDGKGFTAPVSLASGATTDIGGQNSFAVEITGTTTITSFGTNYNGPRFLRFTGALALTHSASLSLPGAANITTAAGDTAIAYPNSASTGWIVTQYQPAALFVGPTAAAARSALGIPSATTPSMVRLNSVNGYGSTSTTVRRWLTVLTNQGTDITYADSATDGSSFTINTAGVYAASYTDNFSAQTLHGLILNSAALTTAASSQTAAATLSLASVHSANFSNTAQWTGFLPAGSVVRTMADGVSTGVAARTTFSIVRVA